MDNRLLRAYLVAMASEAGGTTTLSQLWKKTRGWYGDVVAALLALRRMGMVKFDGELPTLQELNEGSDVEVTLARREDWLTPGEPQER